METYGAPPSSHTPLLQHSTASPQERTRPQACFHPDFDPLFAAGPASIPGPEKPLKPPYLVEKLALDHVVNMRIVIALPKGLLAPNGGRLVATLEPGIYWLAP
jgi:hypothetical protein